MYKPAETKNCLYCGQIIYKEVWRSRSEWKRRKFCDRSCFGKHHSKNKSFGNPWTEEEKEFLKRWSGKKRVIQIVETFNKKAQKAGWRQRSRSAIEVQMNRLGLSKRSTTDNFSARQLSEILEITHTRVQRWIKAGLIDREKQSDRLAMISRANFKKFAVTYPEKLWGIDPKQLRKVINDGLLVRHIAKVSNSLDKDGGCPIVLIRLDTGDVYDSIKSAAVSVQVELDFSQRYLAGKISESSKSDRDFCGIDWTRLQYPTFWIPAEIKPEFDRLAGGLLHWFYLELRNLPGYSKTTCLAIASKNAVNLTLWSFKKQQKLKAKGKELTPKEILLDKAKQTILNKILLFEKLPYSQSLLKIKNTFIRQVYACFSVLFNGQQQKIYLHAEESALEFIAKMTERYFKKHYLPLNYQTENKLERADLLATIFASIIAYVEVRENVYYSLAKLFAWSFIEKQGLKKEISFDPEIKINIPENNYEVAYSDETESSDRLDICDEDLLENLLEKLKKKVSKIEYEKLSMYIALKLEGASDIEAADAMTINRDEISLIQQKLLTVAQFD